MTLIRYKYYKLLLFANIFFSFAYITIISGCIFFDIKTIYLNWIVVGFSALLAIITSTTSVKLTKYSNQIINISFIAICGWAIATTIAKNYLANELVSTILWACVPFVLSRIFFIGKILSLPSKTKTKFIKNKEKNLQLFVLLGIAICIGLFFRFYNLGYLAYDTDEGSTALYANTIAENGKPCRADLCYLRGFPYLYIVAGFVKIFSISEFWVRAAGVSVELLCIIVLSALTYVLWRSKYISAFTAIFLLLADWQLMLARYARMYGTMLLCISIALLAYIKVFYQHKKLWLPILFIAPFIAMLTHQFGFLLIFFIVEPLLTKNWKLYKNTLFIFFALYIVGITFFMLTNVPPIIFSDPNYISFYELHPEKIIVDKFWYLKSIQWPDLTYIKALFSYYPIITIHALLAGYYILRKKHSSRWFVFFILWIFLITAIYNIKYNLKYLWWVFSLVDLLAIYGIWLTWKWKKIYAISMSIILLGQTFFGAYTILNRDYGKPINTLPVLSPAHVEAYYPDDKSGVEYVLKHAGKKDIIITDYWMQDVYLEISGHARSNARLSRWDEKTFLKKFPYYALYHSNDKWYMEKDGPLLIGSVKRLQLFLNKHRNKTIWYISSVDFTGKKYLYISEAQIDAFIRDNFLDQVVHIGKDGNTRVYKIEANQ